MKYLTTSTLAASIIVMCLASPSEAKPVKQMQVHNEQTIEYSARRKRVRSVRHRTPRRSRVMQNVGMMVGEERERSRAGIVAHPAGCPGRAFCGCGVSVKVFGHPVRNLFLAANWRKFPSASPGPGMVAWRYGHVMYIMSAHGNGTATVYDPNSGGHRTRIHTRSLAGYRVVNPHGSRMAMR